MSETSEKKQLIKKNNKKRMPVLHGVYFLRAYRNSLNIGFPFYKLFFSFRKIQIPAYIIVYSDATHHG